MRQDQKLTNGQVESQRGFTLVELMVGLTVMGVIITAGVPALQGFVAGNRVVSDVNAVVGSIQFARSEAVRRGRSVEVVASDPSVANNEFGPGFQVRLVSDGTVLKQHAAFSGARLDSLGSDRIIFRGDGSTAAETLELCSDSASVTGRKITVLAGGTIRSTSDPACA